MRGSPLLIRLFSCWKSRSISDEQSQKEPRDNARGSNSISVPASKPEDHTGIGLIINIAFPLFFFVHLFICHFILGSNSSHIC